MELELLRGPLEARWLESIANLYGEFNRKYRDPEFCRRLFNENPHGYSLHAFLVHPGRGVVGHYGIIPMAILVEGRRAISGKGEAFVVHPNHREDTVRVEGDEPVAGGLAMPLHLYRYAREQGMELVHMITGPEVGLIHRMTGCTGLRLRHHRATLTLSSDRAASPHPPSRREGLLVPLRAAQGIASGMASAALLVRWERAEPSAGGALSDERLAQIVDDLEPVRGWTLAIDSPTLSWFARVGDLQVIALDDRMEDYALVCGRSGQGREMEIVLWHQRSTGLRPALRLLAAVIRSARRRGNPVVAFSPGAAWNAAARARLRTAGRLLFFRERMPAVGVYVYTSDRYYRDPDNLHFTPFFHAVF
ncbi:MAG TPA: hypothetical protein VI792_09325 [Candidatus Eisenbacteria bacterium]